MWIALRLVAKRLAILRVFCRYTHLREPPQNACWDRLLFAEAWRSLEVCLNADINDSMDIKRAHDRDQKILKKTPNVLF